MPRLRSRSTSGSDIWSVHWSCGTACPTLSTGRAWTVRISPSDGLVRTEDGSPLRVEYLLTDGSITPDGEAVARDEPIGTTLWRIGGDVVSTTTIAGLYPNDTWSGEQVTWTRRRCRGGELTVLLSSDPSLFPVRLAVTASIDGSVVGRARVRPNEQAELRVPLPDGRETCVVTFDVTPTAVPSRVLPDNADDRVLGAHFNSFVYEPAE